MFYPTKPGSEEFGDTRLKEKKIERYIYNRVFIEVDAKQGPFRIQLNEMAIENEARRKTAVPLEGPDLSGSEYENSID